MTMILRTSVASPFGRKVRMAIQVLGLQSRVEVRLADTGNPADSLRRENPLGKIPALLLEDGEALFDSRVIVDYLDELDGRQILIPPRPHRIAALTQQALADGILDAAILQVYEARFRPAERHSPEWLEHQRGKVARALAHASAHLPVARAEGLHIGEIALAAALDYLDLRFAGAWRETHPRLREWLEGFQQRMPAMAAIG